MRIVKVYPSEYNDDLRHFDDNSILIRKIKEKYDYTSVTFSNDMSEEDCADVIRQYDVLLTAWGSPHIPNSLAHNPGNLKYICNITGEMSKWIDRELVESPYITITNWGDAPAYDVAEGAVVLLMTLMKDIPLHIKNCATDSMKPPKGVRQLTLFGTAVGIYGMGVIARKFVDMLRPFGARFYAYDPYVDNMPEGVTKVNSLEELFSVSRILAVHAALCDETKDSITEELLALLPDGAVFINTARGRIIKDGALEKELLKGRIRAGLDVFSDGNCCEPDSPLRGLNNVIFTYHGIGGKNIIDGDDANPIVTKNCLDNLERFSKGEELQFVMTPERFKIST